MPKLRIEDFADVRARLDAGESEEAVFAQLQITEETWLASEQGVTEGLAAEVDRGGDEQLVRFREAYRRTWMEATSATATRGTAPQPAEGPSVAPCPTPPASAPALGPSPVPARPLAQATYQKVAAASAPVVPAAAPSAPAPVANPSPPAAVAPPPSKPMVNIPPAHLVGTANVDNAALMRAVTPFVNGTFEPPSPGKPPVASEKHEGPLSGTAAIDRAAMMSKIMPFLDGPRPPTVASPTAPRPPVAPAPAPAAPPPAPTAPLSVRTAFLNEDLHAAVRAAEALPFREGPPVPPPKKDETPESIRSAPGASVHSTVFLPEGMPLPPPRPTLMPIEEYARVSAILEPERDAEGALKRLGITREMWTWTLRAYAAMFAADPTLESHFRELVRRATGYAR